MSKSSLEEENRDGPMMLAYLVSVRTSGSSSQLEKPLIAQLTASSEATAS